MPKPEDPNVAVVEGKEGEKLVIDQKQLEMLKELLQKQNQEKQHEKELEIEQRAE